MSPSDMNLSLLPQLPPAMFSQVSTRSNSANSSDSNSLSDKKLRAAAAEFESMLLANLWKSMKSTFASSEEESTDPAHNSLEDWGIQAMAGAVGKTGGLGLGKLILKHLELQLPSSPDENAEKGGKAISGTADMLLE